MKRLVLLLVCVITPLFSSDIEALAKKAAILYDQIEIVDNPVTRSFLKTNISLLEDKIQKQAERTERHILQYHQRLENSENTYESDWLMKKIKSQEKKAQNLDDLLDTIALWKGKL